MATGDLFLGIDIGTSGVRAVAIDRAGRVCAQAARAIPAPIRDGPLLTQEPEIWWHAVSEVLAALSGTAGERIRSLAVDGTSGTLLLADERGDSLTVGLMYNDASSVAEAQRIKQVAPAESGGHGASAALAKLLRLQSSHPKARYALHQADWIVGKLSGRYGVSDENNVLKLGYDVAARRWPEWFDQLGVRRELLPEVFVPGEAVAKIDSQVARKLGLRDDITIAAGSTDGVAGFLATGAAEIGDAVTSLGSTLVIKVLSQRSLFAPQFGIYSHRLGDMCGCLAAPPTPAARRCSSSSVPKSCRPWPRSWIRIDQPACTIIRCLKRASVSRSTTLISSPASNRDPPTTSYSSRACSKVSPRSSTVLIGNWRLSAHPIP